MKLESRPQKRLLIGIVIIIIVILAISLIVWNNSAPTAKIIQINQFPSNPSSYDVITIEVIIDGGTPLFSKPDLDIGFVTQNSQGTGIGGASLSQIEKNTYQIELNPIEDDTVLWYVITLKDRGVTSFTDYNLININATSSLPSDEIVILESSILWSYDPISDSESGVLIANISANFTIQRVEYSIIGFTPSGTFATSGSVSQVEINTYIIPLGPDILQDLEESTVFYNFLVLDDQGHFFISEINSQAIYNSSK